MVATRCTRATILGPETLDLLGGRPHGQARSLGRHALALWTSHEDIVWCDHRPDALGPRGITLTTEPPPFDGPVPWTWLPRSATIACGEALQIDLRAATIAAWSAVRVPVTTPRCRGPVDLPGPARPDPALGPDLDPVREEFVRARTLWETSLEAGLDPVRARSLVGLGPGLTPSGDDVLGGFVLVGAACGALPADFAEALREEARTATHSLSRARLEHHLRAEGSVAECRLVRALLDRDLRAATTHAEALSRFGHHSGADFLDGALAALRTFAR